MTRVGYVPYSQDLQHPADRRRLATWAIAKGISLNVDNPLDSDVLVLSNAANFGYWLKRAQQPVILDLVDGYLGEKPSFLRDLLRNTIRSFRGTSSFGWITYTRHLKSACALSSAIIVASPEQRDLVLPFNSKVYVILDDHSELETKSGLSDSLGIPETSKADFIFWEGFGYTLKHFRVLSEVLDKALFENNWGMYLLTVKSFPRWGGYIGKVSTQKLIKKWFPLSSNSIQIIPWSIKNLITYSRQSKFAIIPINGNDKFAISKSENKLLSLWKLGLPTLYSDIPSYKRVGELTQTISMCVDASDWQEKLANIMTPDDYRKKIPISINEYLIKTHSHDLLVEQWDELIAQSLKENYV